MTTAEKVLAALIENEHSYQAYGVRTDSRVLSIGDELGASTHEDDMESYDLNGTCATGMGQLWFDEDDMENIEKALEIQTQYTAGHQYLIAGDGSEYGNDKDEVIISNAVVIAVLR